MTNHDEIQNRAAFDRVRYANCWEDADILCEALAVQKGGPVSLPSHPPATTLWPSWPTIPA